MGHPLKTVHIHYPDVYAHIQKGTRHFNYYHDRPVFYIFLDKFFFLSKNKDTEKEVYHNLLISKKVLYYTPHLYVIYVYVQHGRATYVRKQNTRN